MNEHEAQRFLNEQRYQAELPFPVSAVFTHYARSSSKNYALRSLQLVATAQSTIRYAAIAAACDYSTNPDADESVLNWLRQEWLGGKKPSFGTWYGALMRLLAESGKSWRNPFVPEFSAIDRELLEKKIQPLIHSRNVEIGHAEYYEALALKHFVELQEENLFAVIEQFSFLSRYPLAFAEVEDDYEPLSPGTKQAVNICRGASHNFARYTVAPSHPLPPGIPFIWNPEYTGILTLSPFLIYGRATTDAEQKEKVKGVAHIQGLMVLNGVIKGSPVYTSVDAEAQFSLDSFEFPPKEKIQSQVDSALKKGLDVPARKETRLSEDEKELFVRTTDYVSQTVAEEKGEPSKRTLRWKNMLIPTALGILLLVAGFVIYSRYIAPKAPKSIAVLSFKDISPTKDYEYLGDGIANAIIDKLNNLGGLRVIASTSTFLYKGKDKPISDIGKELNVGWVLEGDVLKAENRLQVTARLIRVSDQSLVFSEPYNKDFSDIFTILKEISTGVAGELKGELQVNEKVALAKKPTNNQEAYDLYLKGNKKLSIVGKKEDFEQAFSCFRQAVALDPRFAEAYAGMAYSYARLSDIANARKYLEQALTINSRLPEAYVIRFIRLMSTWIHGGYKCGV